ncbi:transposable element Tcb1 transposase [Trichonephila clavipes]|nr:transposable element Tcb1 transposase [Trichonephila clavipes]
MMVWSATGYTSRSPLVRIDGPFNSTCYIYDVLRLGDQPFIGVLRNPMFKQDNARPHVAGIVRTFLETENFRLALSNIFTGPFTNRKRLVYYCRVTGSSPYASHYI